jgi:hypothetical protein
MSHPKSAKYRNDLPVRLTHGRILILPKLLMLFLIILGIQGQVLAQLDNGIVATNLGKGDWIWEMSACETSLDVTNPQAVLQYEANRGMQWITVKAGDGTNKWSQWNSNLVVQAHVLGLKIFAWAYAYGNASSNSSVSAESALANWAIAQGADGFIIDAEGEYEQQPGGDNATPAAQYCQAIRAQYPNRFLAYAPFVSITGHPTYPYIQFGQYCNAVMPQDYWADIGVSVNQMVNDMDSQWGNWQSGLLGGPHVGSIKPIVPVGQGYQTSGYSAGVNITSFVNLLKSDTSSASAGGYRGVSFWSCQDHMAADWSAISATTIGSSAVLSPGIISINLAGTNMQLNGSNGVEGTTCRVLTSTNAALPLNLWKPISTNVLNAGGNFTITVTNAVSANVGQQFYILAAP